MPEQMGSDDRLDEYGRRRNKVNWPVLVTTCVLALVCVGGFIYAFFPWHMVVSGWQATEAIEQEGNQEVNQGVKQKGDILAVLLGVEEGGSDEALPKITNFQLRWQENRGYALYAALALAPIAGTGPEWWDGYESRHEKNVTLEDGSTIAVTRRYLVDADAARRHNAKVISDLLLAVARCNGVANGRDGCYTTTVGWAEEHLRPVEVADPGTDQNARTSEE